MDGPTTVEGMVGESAAMRALVADIARLAPLPAPVVILGERGTGKELVARALHAQSGRPAERFARTNCALLSREFARSELFGHERGAFTGAVGDRKGLLREAHQGTIFLDEVGEFPLDVQAGLLRVLETGEVQPLGGAIVTVSVRVVAATNADLERWTAEGRFRADLYDRLAEFVLRVPTLRARLDDLPLLVDHFLHQLNRAYDVAIDGVTPAALELLAAHPWPGNVRELRRVLGRSMVGRQAGMLRPEDLRHPDGTPLLTGPRDAPRAGTASAPRRAPLQKGRQQTAVWLARTRGHVSSGALARACRISEEAARRELVGLARAGYLQREGGGRTTRYVLAEPETGVTPAESGIPREAPLESPPAPAGRPD
jgi:DNA-binding NtrC family response regulator